MLPIKPDAIDHTSDDLIVGRDALILVTGASGFIGSRLVRTLLDLGFHNLRCFVRPSAEPTRRTALTERSDDGAHIEVVEGNLLSRGDCDVATRGAAVVFHLAAGRGEKSFPDAFLNSVVTTRNLLEAGMQHNSLKRFVNVSSFAVYANTNKPKAWVLDESCPIETRPELRGDPYCFAKVKQDELVTLYGKKYGIPYVIVRPGYVYGPGKDAINARVGIGTFGLFVHLGGPNVIPLTYMDNCAQAILLAGLKRGTEGEVFNIVDDDLPTSRAFLRSYKRCVKPFPSIYVPHFASYLLCCLWEQYSAWSEGQLPPVFNRCKWRAIWRRTRYSNEKLKSRVGWRPAIPTAVGLQRYFESCREGRQHA